MEEKDTFHLTGPGSGRSHSALVLALALPRLNGFEGRKGLHRTKMPEGSGLGA